MIRRWVVTWQAILLTAVLLGGGGAVVFGQMTGARLPLQGVGLWAYDPNLGSFFSVRVDQDGTLLVSGLAGGGLFSIIPGVGPSGFFLTSIIPGVGPSGFFLTSIIPGVGPSGFFLVSINPAFGSLDRFIVSQYNLWSIAGEMGLKAGALISGITGFGNIALTSSLNGSFNGADLTSALNAQGSRVGGIQLNSTHLVAGSPGVSVAVKRYSFTPGSLTSIGIFSAPGSGTISRWLSSAYYGAQGGVSNQPFGTSSPRPGNYFCTSSGDGLWGGVLGSVGANFDVLWSYETC